MAIVVILLILIASYLLYTSGALKKIDFKKIFSKKDTEEDINAYELDEILPGMLGSDPSDEIDVYDSKKPVILPMDGAINVLLDSFKNNANQVYMDFKNNLNSQSYKSYIFDDYKIELLRRSGFLDEKQNISYNTIRNTIVKDINNIFTYYLDKIKYNEDKNYFTLRREILSKDGFSLNLDEREINSVTNYVLSNTKIPGNILLLLKYKINQVAQNLIDQVVMLSGFNYTTVLETLEQVLVR